ncbi:MAG: peptidylprolyl isomerase [Planctomycetes bacterium]|nr:peptidylprolyl isomerase [Planctomycetota bacterium]
MLLTAGCAAPPGGRSGASPLDAPAPRVVAPVPAAVSNRLASVLHPGTGAGVQGPALLEPARPADDAVVATVGDVAIRKSHVFDRLAETDRRRAQLWIDVLVMDAVVAQFARRYGIEPDAERIAQLAGEEEELLRAQVDVELQGRLDFDGYLQRQFGLSRDEYRAELVRDVTRVRYRGLVIRYLAMLEDRVEVRFITHSDPQVLEDARRRALDGADFASLARRLSDDDTRSQGGYLAPFGRGFRHPIARAAFELAPGEVSPVVSLDGAASGGAPRYALVYCLRRLPPRDEPFAAVRSELAAELDARPIQPFEQTAFTLQYCRSSTAPADASLESAGR